MVPKLHKKGTSFKGAAAYLLHDKNGAMTSKRVEWSETYNLATSNPESAWKVMAATAMNQDDLKAKAKVRTAGRKSADSVLHLSLSWHPDEKRNLNRDEMRRAALGALRALKADDRQALIICHNDERQPHVHVLINRVSPVDGRMLSSSKEKIALSQWAEAYERERGLVLCGERALNNAQRERKKYTRGKKDQARHIYEENQTLKPDEKARAQQRQKIAALARKTRELKERQKQQRADLSRQHKERVREIKAQALKEMTRRKDAVRETLRPERQALYQEQQEAMKAFYEREKSLIGRVYNALRAIDFKAIMRGERYTEDGRKRRGALDEAFNVLSKAGARLEAIKRQQTKEQSALDRKENKAERIASVAVRQERDELLNASRMRFVKERNDLSLIQKMDGAKLRAERKTAFSLREPAQKDSKGRTPQFPTKIVETKGKQQTEDRYERPRGPEGRAPEKDRFERDMNKRGRE
jgi:hypothetical protein